MRIFSSVFGLIILILVLSFALSNKQDVTVGMWPFKDSIQAPLYAVGLAPLAFGFFFGSFWGWISGLPHRLHVRRLNKELASLSNKLGELQKNVIVQQEKVKPKSSFWSRP
jgi:lipopolysaccharide assembly protein A